MSLFRGSTGIGTGTIEAKALTLSDYDTASWNVYSFFGNGTSKVFNLETDAGSSNNTQIYIDGVYQEKETYSLTETVLTFSEAPPLGASIEVMVAEIMPIGVTTSDLVSHLPEGTGASFTDVQTELRSLKKAVGGTNQILSVDTFTGDGSTTTFTMTDSVGDSSTITVVIDGLVQEISSYSVTNGTSLIFSQAPLLGSIIEVRALVRGDIVSTELKTNEFAGNGTTIDFTLSASAIKNNTFVYINGVYQFKSTYAVSDTTLTFSTAPPTNSVIEVMLVGFTTSIVATPSADSVGTLAIQDNAVTQAKIADDAVTQAKIADDAVTQAKIANDAVGADQLASNAVVTASIVDANVTTAKIANNAVTAAKVSSDIKVAGLETIYVPAAAMYPNSTAGCADLEQVELSNGPELKCLDFDAGSDENAQFTVAFPKSWNEGTVTFQAFFTVTGTNTGTVAWGLSGVSFADNASINTAFGTNVVATAKAHSGTSNDMNVTAVSGAVTITGAAVDTQTYFQVMRDVSADNQTGDARLLGIKLFFTTNASNDA
tara:strand:+ start:292 stop:1923 length:1632 start_codon:yes stop_codon:yes gene_type:complete